MADAQGLSKRDIKRLQDKYYNIIKNVNFYNFKIDVLKEAKKGNFNGLDALKKAVFKNFVILTSLESKLDLKKDVLVPIKNLVCAVTDVFYDHSDEKLRHLFDLKFDDLKTAFETLLTLGLTKSVPEIADSDDRKLLRDPRIIKKHKSIIKSIERLKDFVKSLPEPGAPPPAASAVSAADSAPDLTLPLIKKYWTDFWRQFFRCARYQLILDTLRTDPSSSVSFLSKPREFFSDVGIVVLEFFNSFRPGGVSKFVPRAVASAYTSVSKQVYFLTSSTAPVADITKTTKGPLNPQLAINTIVSNISIGTIDMYVTNFVTEFIKNLGHDAKNLNLKPYYKRNFVNVIVKQTANLKTLAGQYKAQAVTNANSYIAKAEARGKKVSSLMKDFYKVLLKSPRDDNNNFTYKPPEGTFNEYLTVLNTVWNEPGPYTLLSFPNSWLLDRNAWLSLSDGSLPQSLTYMKGLFSPKDFNSLCSEIKTETKKLKAIIANHKKVAKNNKHSVFHRLMTGGL